LPANVVTRLSTVGDGHLIPVVFGVTMPRASATSLGQDKIRLGYYVVLRDPYLDFNPFSAEFSFTIEET